MRPASTPVPDVTCGVSYWPGRESRSPPETPATLLGDVLDAAAVAWSARRIAAGQAVIVPSAPQHDRQGREIAIRF